MYDASNNIPVEDIPVCPGCQHFVLRKDTVRLSCPFCGTLLGPREGGRRSSSGKRLPLPKVANQRQPEPRRSIGNSLSRFFQNLRRRRSGQGEREANSDDEDYFADQGPSTSSRDSQSLIRKSRSISSLPRIPPSTSSSTNLTTRPTSQSSRHRHSPAGIIHVRPFKASAEETQSENRILDKIYSLQTLEKALDEAKTEEEFGEIAGFYGTAFNSFQDINIVFKRKGVDPRATGRGRLGESELDCVFVDGAFARLTHLPPQIQKSVLKAIINCLLSDQRTGDVALMKPVCRDDLRAYMVLLQYPQFQKASTYVIYAHLLRQVATLCDSDHQQLAHWLTQLSSETFRSVVLHIQQFIGIRLFPARPQDLPPMSKCTWWIPCAVKSLAILNAANDAGGLIPFTAFYNAALDHWDLMADCQQWQTPTLNTGFSFCQYPFILSVNAKKTLMEGHAEQQMIATARDSIIGTLAVRRTPDMDMLFLNITVRRDNLLQDSLQEVLSCTDFILVKLGDIGELQLDNKQGNLRKKLRIHFAGEPGLDMGGPKKEWFQLLVRQIFHPDYGMFVYHKKAEVYWFSTMEAELDETTLKEYHLVGILMGLAVYNSVILDIRFPLCCYRKLLSPPLVPRILDIHSTPLGVTPLGLDDLAQISPEVAGSLRQLLEYDGDVEEDFCLTFQISLEEFGVVRTVELKEGGKKIPVTKENREEYVRLYVDWWLNGAMGKQFKAFYLGFHSVCSTNLLLVCFPFVPLSGLNQSAMFQLFRPAEIELLVCGSPTFDMEELRKVTVYDGYAAQDKTVRYFWDLVLKLPQKHQKRLLLFVTGSDRVPAGGLKEMAPPFKLSRMVSSNPNISPEQMLPMAHTCFNQLILPNYQSRSQLRQKLAIALAHGEGFGLE